MAILWADGFDHYGTSNGELLNGAYSQVAGTGNTGVTISSTTFRTGTHAIRFIGVHAAGGSDILRKALPQGAETAVGVGFAMYCPNLPFNNTDGPRLEFRDIANAANVTVNVLSTGALRAYRGTFSGTTLGTTSGPVITAEAWNHIEIYVEFSQTVGVVKIRVNNVEVLALTGIDTVNTSNVECSQIAFTNTSQGSSVGAEYFIDDLYVYDTSGSHGAAYPIGDLQAMKLTATADTAEADWTPSTGSDEFAMIDEATPNDADYVSSGTATDRSDYAMTDLPAEINYVETLFSHVRTLKTDAGPAQLQQSFMQGSDQSAGTDRVVTTAATYWFDNHPTDPTSTVKWTRTGVNSALLRYDRTV